MKHSSFRGAERDTRPSKQPSFPGIGPDAQLSAIRVDVREIGALDRYVNDVFGTAVLSVEEERALAERIERLELAHWQTVLARPEALGVVYQALEPEQTGELEALVQLARTLAPCADPSDLRAKRAWKAATASSAERLRSLDPTRESLKRADTRVREAFAGDAAARESLAAMDRARAAERAAKAQFVEANLRLVLSMARRYEKGRIPLADLVQEGNVGLMIAVERFDHRRGFRFSTYAGWWIRHYLNRAVAKDARLIRVPVHALADAQLVRRAQEASIIKNGRELSDAELAHETGLPLEKLVFVKAHAMPAPATSLDQSIGRDGDQTLHDVLAGREEAAPEERVGLAQWHEEVVQLLGRLTPMEASIIEYRFGLDDEEERSLQEIGEKYDLTRERIRQIQNQALIKLRRALEKMRAARKPAKA